MGRTDTGDRSFPSGVGVFEYLFVQLVVKCSKLLIVNHRVGRHAEVILCLKVRLIIHEKLYDHILNPGFGMYAVLPKPGLHRKVAGNSGRRLAAQRRERVQ